VLWLAVKLPVRRFEYSVLQMDVELRGTLSVPVANSPVAPAAIAITSIAITLAFTVDPYLDHELNVFNRLVTGVATLSVKPVKKSESNANRRKMETSQLSSSLPGA
jgi:hypothetical protein